MKYSFRNDFFRATVRYTVQGIALMPIFAALAFGGAAHLGGLVRSVLAHRATVAMGRISYPLYLWHNTCHLIVVTAVLPQAGGVAQGMLAFGLSAGIASFSYLLIERPALTLKKRFTPHTAKARAVEQPAASETAAA